MKKVKAKRLAPRRKPLPVKRGPTPPSREAVSFDEITILNDKKVMTDSKIKEFRNYISQDNFGRSLLLLQDNYSALYYDKYGDIGENEFVGIDPGSIIDSIINLCFECEENASQAIIRPARKDDLLASYLLPSDDPIEPTAEDAQRALDIVVERGFAEVEGDTVRIPARFIPDSFTVSDVLPPLGFFRWLQPSAARR